MPGGSDDTHGSAERSSRRDQLQALVDRGATAGERAAARVALDELEAKHGKAPAPAGPYSVDNVAFVEEAEVHAAKIATFVVWRASHNDADRLQCWGPVRIRVPDGQVMRARRCAGKVHDTEADRWGVLYRARDLSPE